MDIIKNPKLVHVEWTDAHNNNGNWYTHDEILEFIEDNHFQCSHVGWLIYEDEDCIVLAARKDRPGDQYGLIEKIPKRMVESRVDLKTA